MEQQTGWVGEQEEVVEVLVSTAVSTLGSLRAFRLDLPVFPLALKSGSLYRCVWMEGNLVTHVETS